MIFDLSSRLVKAQITAVVLICLSNFFMFVALLTPAWQVAKDTDAGIYVQSGLWLYCPGTAQCWYIFSDDVANYYERVDVCRFFLIGDCRKKLLRTPYFFGWHYAVLITIIFALIFGTTSFAALAISLFKKNKARILTITFNGFAFLAFLFLAIALAVFVINAEMLESRYLIGIKNTFRKEYGYSFYLASLAMLLLLFGLLAGVMVATFTFFSKGAHDHSAVPGTEEDDLWQRNQLYALRKLKEVELQSSLMSSSTAIPVFEQQVFEQPPRPGSVGGSHSNTPLPPPEHFHSRGGYSDY